MHSDNGLSWDTVNASTAGLYNFVTKGSLDTLYLGHNTITETGTAPTVGNLTSFNPIRVAASGQQLQPSSEDYVAGLFGGTNGNSQIATSALVDANGDNIISFPNYYENVTLNSAIILKI
ncbi:hypothetical protein [Marinospirillum insulare]|uniref:Uncharacterized protein n=1 Tax=Marinospirillum insulare TaxID=217169 RepID=A0ABQ5ZWE8_9GAMM|nr:hypothetical protein [Marinospirillum insulare]GLR64510.1 hypothetical protein GCM10007878_19480 [Marinospirillum insulare]